MKINSIADFENYVKISLKNKYNCDFDVFTIAKCMFYICDVKNTFVDEIIDFVLKQGVLNKYTISESRFIPGAKNIIFTV